MLSGYEFIVSKQVQWAKNQGFSLTGSKGERGRKSYTLTLDENLFEPLTPEVQEQIGAGNGQELAGTVNSPAKMQALHSSSALGVNIFQYWQKHGLLDEIATACGFCRKGGHVSEYLVFEDKYPIRTYFKAPPNIDVVFHNNDTSPYQFFAVECKFSESYGGRHHGGLDPAYLREEFLWKELPALKELAREICPEDERYVFLHAAQLIKHILGLREKVRGAKKKFRLLYLWYDVLGKEGSDHRAEVEDFKLIAQADGIIFHAITYQELILNLAKEFRVNHPAFIKYLTDRYL